MDPDPRIRTTDLQLLIRIRILLFSSVADKTPTKNKFFSNFFGVLLFEGTFTTVFIVSQKEVAK